MPVYQKAKPFDIVQTILNMQKAIKQLQILNPGTTTPWQQVALSNSWTGTLNARVLSPRMGQLSAHALAPGTVSSGIVIATLPTSLIPVGAHEFPVSADVAAAVTSGVPRCAVHTDGTLLLFGLGSTVSEVSFEIAFPLDI